MDSEEGIPLPKVKYEESRWRRLLKRRLPILQWGGRYSRLAAVGDLVAGITLGLTLVPQSIAYASLANLPVQYGLYSAFLGTMLYVFLGTVKEVSIGPTSLMSLLTLQTCRGLPVEFVVLLTFLSGCLVLVMGLLRLGFLVDLISPAMTSGFTSATAVIIVVAQLKGLLGISFVAETVTENLVLIADNWRHVRLGDCVLSAVCCTVLLLLRKLKDLKVGPKREQLRKTLWFVSISRNAIVVLLASVFAFCTYDPDHLLVKLSGRVEPGLPRVALPPFSAQLANSTVPFSGMVHRLGVGLAMMPIVMVLANIAIAKAFSSGARVDATQEMLTLGLVNVCGSLVQAMPTCGAFTRSAVSHSSGVRTPAAGLYSGIITLLALAFMTKYFYFIPKACLSSVLICAVIFMIDISILKKLWVSSKSDLAVLVVTFLVSVWRSVELGLLAGSLAALAVLLRRVMRPPLHATTVKGGAGAGGGEVVRVRPTLAAAYLNAAQLEQHVLAAAARCPRLPLLVDCSSLSYLDYTAGQAMERLAKKFKEEERELIFYNASKEVLVRLERLECTDSAKLRARTVEGALAARHAGGGRKGERGREEALALLLKEDNRHDSNV